MSNTQEMNNNPLIKMEDNSKYEDQEEDSEEDKKFMEKMNRLDELLTKYEELKEEEMKLDIWNAHVRDEIIGIEMKDGVVFVGKSRFSMNTNYTSTEQLKQLFHIDFRLANGLPFGYHIGGGSVDLFTSKIRRIFLMTPREVSDANQYANMAPEFIKRILPGF